ncbi:MAG TPA: PAS domain S-box protein [Dissulfurispiraceae bacterium]|nr:PAS domain S-box protein [Dissulfurispiraceae bacterium]
MDELLALHAFTTEVSSILSVSGVVDKTIKQIAAVLEPDAVFLFLREDDTLLLRGHWERTSGGMQIAPDIKKVGVCLCGLAVSECRPHYSKDINTDPLCTLNECKEAGIRSFAALPLTYRDRVLGVLSLASFRDRDFAGQQTFLGILTSHVSSALQNAYYHEQMQRYTEAITEELRERTQAETRLRESEQRYRTLVEDMPAMICRFLPDGTLTFVNSMYCGYFRRTRDQLEGQNFFQFIPEQDREKVRKHYLSLTTDNPMVTYQHEVIGPDGGIVRQEWTDRAILDDQGNLIEYQSIGQDVTERWQAEHALRQSEQRFRTVVQNAQAVIFILDRDGVFQLSEGRALARLGLEPGQVVGLSALELYKDYPAVIESLKGALAGEIRRTTTQVQGISFDTLYSPFYDAGGNLAGVIGMATDITELLDAQTALRESEQRFRTLADASFEGIALTEEGRFVDLNDQLAAMLGYDRDEVIGKPVIDFVAAQSRERVSEAMQSNLCDPYEHFALRKDGTVLPVEARARSAEFRGRQLRVTAIRDMTERKQAEEEKRRLQEQMLHVQKLESLGVLAGGIAHDFNNLLMAILGNADLALLRLPPGSPARQNIQEIEKASIRASDLCRQMLAYSGKGKFVVESLDLSQIVSEMTHMLEVSISKKAILRYEFGKNLPLLKADATQIRQVIMNLIINASDAIGERSGVISIVTGAMDCDRNYLRETYLDENLSEGLYVYIEVSDTGAGMDENTKQRIFDPFFSTKFTGRGLGLAAVLGIVRGHHGAVKVYSEPGKGTTFKVLFPAVAGETAGKTPDADLQEKRIFGGHILLIDDEETIRAVGRNMLEMLGFQVFTAANGREGLDVFRSHANKIVCVMLDLTMPRMSGEETFRELRQLHRNVPVVMSSGYNEQEVSQRFVGKGLAGFIQKPYTLKVLRDTLRNVLDKTADQPGQT